MGGPLGMIGHTSIGRAFVVLLVALAVIAIVKGIRGGRAIGSLPVVATGSAKSRNLSLTFCTAVSQHGTAA